MTFIKKIAPLLFLLLAFMAVHAQEKKVQVNLNKYEVIQEAVDLGDNGFIIKTGILTSGSKAEIRLLYYDKSCQLIWEKQFKSHYGTKGSNYLVASPDGDVVYFVEIKDEIYKKNLHYITQISKNGTIRHFETPGKEAFGKSMQAIFCDDQYLYYLTTEEGFEKHGSRKIKEKLILNRFDRASFFHDKQYVEIPTIAEGDNTTFWSFIGQSSEGKYLLSKTIDVEANEVHFNLLLINKDGTARKNQKIKLSLSEIYLRPAFSVLTPSKGYTQVSSLDNAIVTKKSGTPGANAVTDRTRTEYTLPVTFDGAFSNLQFDPAGSYFYAYGLFGPKPFRKLGPTYEGFYIYKYDLEGNLLWKLQQAASAEMQNDKYYRVHSTPGQRAINLRTIGQHLNFSIHCRTSLFNHEISKEGKMIKGFQKNNHMALSDNLTYNSTRGSSRSEPYLKRYSGKEMRYKQYASIMNSEAEVLVELDQEGSLLNLLYFKQ